MRIISGSKRGANLFSPTTDETRPTTDRVRENIFNIIRFYLQGKNVLDLFAGSGAMGLEALSQGADSCVFVDIKKEAFDVIEKNIDKLKFKDRARVFKLPFDEFLNRSCDKFDVIFLDPPYHKNLIYEAIKLIDKKKLDSEDCLFVLECDSNEEVILPDGFKIIREKIYGRVKVSLVKREVLI